MNPNVSCTLHGSDDPDGNWSSHTASSDELWELGGGDTDALGATFRITPHPPAHGRCDPAAGFTPNWWTHRALRSLEQLPHKLAGVRPPAPS